jgi:hypothetical protein
MLDQHHEVAAVVIVARAIDEIGVDAVDGGQRVSAIPIEVRRTDEVERLFGQELLVVARQHDGEGTERGDEFHSLVHVEFLALST